MSTPPLPKPLLLHDRTIVAAGLAAVTAAAWIYTLSASHAGAALLNPTTADGVAAARGLLGLIVMWTVMMTAMMLPTAWPMILLFAGVQRRGRRPVLATAVFVGGYLAAWTAYSAVAALGQHWLHSAALLSAEMAAISPELAGGVLIAAGIFQWTPLKEACLRHCRSPVGFVATYWRDGLGGAFGMGLRHGAFCVGCCWALMLLLFAVGVMNLFWMIVLTALTLAEKTVAPSMAPWLRHGSAAGLVVWGALLMV